MAIRFNRSIFNPVLMVVAEFRTICLFYAHFFLSTIDNHR
ncbi:Hypothetical protein ETEE_1320 [Edwardsiella anguillarum ET080813]|uniref:Uncharacterized protein n=1 Tax=Edwardsiella anguillarum ET080813 TaxID=667120 RepID=A0A076LQ76_9GAMM|nr:Hypothetical protein ETEE_1320 [Edwardsiella anguillarum ET080813]